MAPLVFCAPSAPLALSAPEALSTVLSPPAALEPSAPVEPSAPAEPSAPVEPSAPAEASAPAEPSAPAAPPAPPAPAEPSAPPAPPASPPAPAPAPPAALPCSCCSISCSTSSSTFRMSPMSRPLPPAPPAPLAPPAPPAPSTPLPWPAVSTLCCIFALSSMNLSSSSSSFMSDCSGSWRLLSSLSSPICLLLSAFCASCGPFACWLAAGPCAAAGAPPPAGAAEPPPVPPYPACAVALRSMVSSTFSTSCTSCCSGFSAWLACLPGWSSCNWADRFREALSWTFMFMSDLKRAGVGHGTAWAADRGNADTRWRKPLPRQCSRRCAGMAVASDSGLRSLGWRGPWRPARAGPRNPGQSRAGMPSIRRTARRATLVER
ncbi:hypothetical protein R76727_04337 [Ralstonia mannitolilytica]|nr:hypothetical protein R76727_04337 [Ralstonia mannitolilytica]